jgi:hypothetical protein
MITQTPWFERKFDFNFPIGLLPIILERLRGTVFQLEATIKNIPEEQLIIKKDGKWSVKEVIGHLYDLEELWYGRIDDFLSHKEVLRTADLNNTKTHEAGHNSRTVEAFTDIIDNRINYFNLDISNRNFLLYQLRCLSVREINVAQ